MSNFTSRLPVSTSVRRSNYPPQGSTSFINRHSQSNIPTTVRKVNLFTPQTKRPFQTGASSTASKSFMPSMTSDKKYKRPLKPVPERDEQMRMYNSLADFLSSRAPNMPPLDQKKFFSSISTTESARIFEVLIGLIVPDFKVTKLEIDIPEALAQLNYPYIRSVTKSALVSVTTRQAVVGLLVIFDWLRSAVECTEGFNLDYDDGEPVDEVRERVKNILLYPDTYEEKEDELINRIYSSEDPADGYAELEEINLECQRISNEMAENEDLRRQLQSLDDDIAKCEEYEQNLKLYLEEKRKEREASEQRCQRLRSDEKQLRDQMDDLRLQIDSQPYDVDEVKRDQAIIMRLEAELESTNEKVVLQNRENGKRSDSMLLQETSLCEKFEGMLAMIRDLYKDHEAVGFETDTLVKRKQELMDWIRELEQIRDSQPKCLSRCQEILKRFNLFREKLSATDVCLDAELKSKLFEMNKEYETLKSLKVELSEETVPNLDRINQRLKLEFEQRERVWKETQTKLRHQILEEQGRQAAFCQNSFRECDLVQAERVESERLLALKKDTQERMDLNKERFKTVFDLHKEKLRSLVEAARNLDQKLYEQDEIAAENLRVARISNKLIKKRLNFPIKPTDTKV